MSLVFPGAFPTLTTPRLELRELVEADGAAVHAIFSDPEAMRYWSTPPWTDPAQAADFAARARRAFMAREAIRWGLALHASGEVVGTCTLFNLDAQNRRAEAGYILNRAHWGQGLMREALRALFDFGFGSLGLHRIEADIDPRNAASIHALEHFGFAREGLLRERWRVGEEVTDSLLMGLLASDWERSV